MKLLIDAGNSRIKSAFWDGSQLRHGQMLAHATSADTPMASASEFAALWKDIPALDEIWIASVAAATLEHELTNSLAARFAVTPRFARSPANACGVRNAYTAPARLGIDRFLGLVAVHAQFPGAAVIAGCGTALTLDAIDTHGNHFGGLIAPAPGLMRSALLDRTARLGDLAAASIVDFADTTSAAVESGTWLAAVALVERFVTRTRMRVGMEPTMIVCGGGGKRLGALLEVPHRLETDLVLRGLALFADATHV